MKYLLDLIIKSGAIFAAIAGAIYILFLFAIKMIAEWWWVNMEVYKWCKPRILEKVRNFRKSRAKTQEFVFVDPLDR